MAEYAVMPKSDYVDACDAVREKTGGTGAIKSGQLGGFIRSIVGGGSISYREVTNDTGGTTIYIACSDPPGENTGDNTTSALGRARLGRMRLAYSQHPGGEEGNNTTAALGRAIIGKMKLV